MLCSLIVWISAFSIGVQPIEASLRRLEFCLSSALEQRSGRFPSCDELYGQYSVPKSITPSNSALEKLSWLVGKIGTAMQPFRAPLVVSSTGRIRRSFRSRPSCSSLFLTHLAFFLSTYKTLAYSPCLFVIFFAMCDLHCHDTFMVFGLQRVPLLQIIEREINEHDVSKARFCHNSRSHLPPWSNKRIYRSTRKNLCCF